MEGVLENSNPAVFGRVAERKVLPEEEDDDVRDPIDAREVFDILLYSDLVSPSIVQLNFSMLSRLEYCKTDRDTGSHQTKPEPVS